MSETKPEFPSASDTLPATSHSGRTRHSTLQLLAAGGRGLRSLADAAAIADNPAVVADFFGATHVGQVRKRNEDQFLVAALERSLLVEGSSLPAEAGTRLTDTPQGRLLIVADGMGGHGGGELASAVTTDAMALYAFAAMPWAVGRDDHDAEELGRGLLEAVTKAQARVRRVAQRKNVDEALGTTLTLAYLTWPQLHLVHVGDSRAYLFRNGALHRLTKDHTLAQRLVDGNAMTAEEAAHSPLTHVLVNAVGGGTDELDVELHRVALAMEDQLMLCTDGLYDMVPDPTIAEHLARTSEPVDRVVHSLIDAANAAGGRDNVTVVLARF
ncbi:MAG: serine/threonine-protein phosphatase [Myxococcales bacterium]|nr:serine/threonine-protein phosphatase [Myxococcales bacterium]MCB9719174.1 serine/threonine-protein phosphatase [Myxococcales bacterium]